MFWTVLSEQAPIDDNDDRLVRSFVCFTGLGEECIL